MNRFSFTRVLPVLVAVGAGCVLAGPAAAQPINFGARPAEQTHELHFGVGLDSAFVAAVGYSHGVRLFDQGIILTGDLAVPWADFDLADFRLRVGSLVPIAGRGAWRITGKAMPLVRGTRNEVSHMTNVGIDAALMGGYYAPRWFISAEAGVDWAAATYIRHSERYRETVYAGAKDGWYATTGANIYAGLLGGYSFSTWDIVLRAGQARDYQLRAAILPIYLAAGINIRLPASP
jgi:hypothetical protein